MKDRFQDVDLTEGERAAWDKIQRDMVLIKIKLKELEDTPYVEGSGRLQFNYAGPDGKEMTQQRIQRALRDGFTEIIVYQGYEFVEQTPAITLEQLVIVDFERKYSATELSTPRQSRQTLITAKRESDDQRIDVAALIAASDLDSLQDYREALIEQIMSEQQIVSRSWSMIDSPFAQAHQKADHDMLREEFRALIGRAVVLPESIEGLHHLREWHAAKLAKLDSLKAIIEPFKAIVWGDDDPENAVLTPDMATGVRMGLRLAGEAWRRFPLEITTNDEGDDDN